MSEPNEIYVLGAGPAGMAAAYTITKKGQPVVVVEQDSQVGAWQKVLNIKDLFWITAPTFSAVIFLLFTNFGTR
jgi:heterodisulfide reductase subunit A-like polyferredoxin